MLNKKQMYFLKKKKIYKKKKKMNTQDASINLQFQDNGKEKTKGVLKIQHSNGNISLSFFAESEVDTSKGRPIKKYKQIPDVVRQLSDFTKISIDSDDNLSITLQGTEYLIKLFFDQENGSISFFDYLSQKVFLRHSTCNPRIFLLESYEPLKENSIPFI